MIHFDKDEKIIKEIRASRLLVIFNAAAVFLLVLLPLLLYGRMPTVLSQLVVLDGKTGAFLVYSFSLWFLVLWVVFFMWWITYYLHVWIITDSRIFDLTRRHVSKTGVVSVRLEDVTDVTVEYKGGLDKLFRMGNLRVYTLNSLKSTGELVFKSVPHVESVKQVILKAQQDKRDRQATVHSTLI